MNIGVKLWFEMVSDGYVCNMGVRFWADHASYWIFLRFP